MESEIESQLEAEIRRKTAELQEDSGTEEDMAPQENTVTSRHQNGGYGMEAMRRMSAGGGQYAEDGEILEDGEIASDEGEMMDGEGPSGLEEEIRPPSSSPTKKGHKEDRERHSRNKRDRHSKRRRSKEEGHREKQQKKKRHREYIDYDKAGDDADPSWPSSDRRDKGDKKGDRSPPAPYHSPSHDSHGEERGKQDKDGDKHRRGSGEKHHHGSGRDRNRDKDRNHESRDKNRDHHDKDKKDKHERSDKEKKDRDRAKDSHERDFGKPYMPQNDGYESPPGIYDSPSDDEFGENRFNKKPKTMMSLVEGEYMDPALATTENEQMRPKSKKKMQKKKEWQERMRQRERDREFEEEQPVKKKPLLQTPMEERPVCKFFIEGKCQKGATCLFKHDYNELPKRLELCRFYLKAFCRQEEECPYMHSEFPCKYFHTGSTCYQGDNCKFSHAPLTAETEEALKTCLNNDDDDDYHEHFDSGRKHKKKGILGDQPHMSEEELHHKLEAIKKIPSIFDIETFAPGESPNKPPKPSMGKSPSNIRPQGFYQDPNMSPHNGPNPRFNGPPPGMQGTPPQRPFMPGPGGPGMDGPPPGMQGPPMGPPPGGQGMMGSGPMPPMGPPGMQGGPLGPPMNNPPMSQAAALVGAILRAAPMLQRYQGPGPQGGPPTSMANNMNNDPRFMGPNPGMMGPDMTQGPPPLMMNQGQDGPMNQGPNMMGPDNFGPDGPQPPQNLNASNVPSRDPRRNMGASNDPRINRDSEGQRQQDVDMRAGGDGMGDVDLRQDIDMRQEDSKGKIGNTTPQQDWDMDIDNDVDDTDIPAHLPPKQREMFLRIKQQTMKINAQKGDGQTGQRETNAQSKADDDKWYSSDEEEDTKPNMSNLMNPGEIKKESDVNSSINVMQMINAIKSSAPTNPTASARQMDPRMRKEIPVREPTIILSHDGHCPWRLCKVLYTKQRIPDNLEISDGRYKNDPRVQKFLKLHELESGMFIDHSKLNVSIKKEPSEPSEQKVIVPELKTGFYKEPPKTRPELAPFVDPRLGKSDSIDPRIKVEPPPRPLDPRMKQGLDNKPSDPRVKMATHNLPVKPLDPRLARQDSNSSSSSLNSMGRASDPRLARQTSREPDPLVGSMQRSNTPPMDPRQLNRQSSGDPRLQRNDPMSGSASMINKPFDPRLGRVMDSDIAPPPVQRQLSQPSTGAERDAANSSPQRPKLDYRNDPRFKRKHISESNLPPETLGKRYTGQRKSSTEYSSPLGDEDIKSEESGYNSYNRPRPATKVHSPKQGFTDKDSSAASPDLTTHDILDSIKVMPPPMLDPVPAPDKNLKDIFKTIDPTASPFC